MNETAGHAGEERRAGSELAPTEVEKGRNASGGNAGCCKQDYI